MFCVVQLNFQDPAVKQMLDERKEFEKNEKLAKEFSRQMRTGLNHTGPMPGGGEVIDDKEDDDDEVAIQELERSMAKGLKRKRQARAKSQVKASAKRAAKRLEVVKARKPLAAAPGGPPAAAAAPPAAGHPGDAAGPAPAAAAAAVDARGPRAPTDNRATPGDNQIYLAGRQFTRLRNGGLSLDCKHHPSCKKHIGFGKSGQLSEDDCRRRLLAWEADFEGCADAAEHVKRGKLLLSNYAEAAAAFA